MWHTSTGDRTVSGAEATLIAETCIDMVDALEWEIRSNDASVKCETGIELFDQQLVHQRIALVNEVTRALLESTREMLELTAERESTVMAIFETIKAKVGLEINGQQCFDDTCCEVRSMVLAAYGFGTLDTNAPGGDGFKHAEDIDDDESAASLINDSGLADMEIDALELDVLGLDELELEGLALGDLEFSCDESDGIQNDDLPDPWCDDLQQWDLLIEMLADRILWDRDFEMASLIVDEEPDVAQAYKQMLGIQRDYFAIAPPEVEEQDALPALHDLRSFLAHWAAPRNSH